MSSASLPFTKNAYYFCFVLFVYVLFLKFDLFNPLDELRLSKLGPLIKALNVLGISAIY